MNQASSRKNSSTEGELTLLTKRIQNCKSEFDAEQVVCDRIYQPPAVGFVDFAHLNTNFSLTAQNDTYSFSILSTGHLNLSGKLTHWGHPFKEHGFVTFELDMNLHRCFIFSNEFLYPFQICELPNELVLASSFSTALSTATIQSVTEMTKTTYINRMPEKLFFNGTNTAPLFLSIPSNDVIVTQQEIDRTTPGTPYSLPCTPLYDATHDIIASAIWKASKNAVIEQRGLPFITYTQFISPPTGHIRFPLEFVFELPRSFQPNVHSSQNLSYDVALMNHGIWDAFFGITIDERPDPSSPSLSDNPLLTNAAVRTHSSAVPLGADHFSIAITTSGYIFRDRRVIGTSERLIERSQNNAEVAVDFLIPQRTVRFMFKRSGIYVVLAEVFGVPENIRIAVCLVIIHLV